MHNINDLQLFVNHRLVQPKQPLNNFRFLQIFRPAIGGEHGFVVGTVGFYQFGEQVRFIAVKLRKCAICIFRRLRR